MTTTNAPAQLFASLPSDDIRSVFGRATNLAGSVIAGVRPDQLDRQTPCEDFNARKMIQHLIGVLERIAVVGTGASPFTVPGFAGGVADADFIAAWNAEVDRVENVWSDDAVLTRDVLVPWGKDVGGVALTRYVNEVSVHTWDLAKATDQQPAWNDDVLQVAYSAMTTLLPVEGRRAIYDVARAAMPPEMAANFKDPFVDPVSVAEDAPVIDRLVAFSGRQP